MCICCEVWCHKVGLLVGILLTGAGFIVFGAGWGAALNNPAPIGDALETKLTAPIVLLVGSGLTLLISISMFDDRTRRFQLVYYVANVTLLVTTCFAGATGYMLFDFSVGDAGCGRDDVSTNKDEFLDGSICTQVAVAAAGICLQLVAMALLNVIYIFISDYDGRGNNVSRRR